VVGSVSKSVGVGHGGSVGVCLRASVRYACVWFVYCECVVRVGGKHTCLIEDSPRYSCFISPSSLKLEISAQIQ